MKLFRIFWALFCAIVANSIFAAGYTDYLTSGRGFTEVTSTSGITGSADDYYILTSAENTGLIVGVGRYEAKPDWASEESKALHYLSAASDPVLDLTNFFTIEKSGSYIGLRNVVYCADMFQTHDNAGYMYVNTYTDKNLDEWSYLIPTYQNGYWTFENGKYPVSSGNWASGYLGPWHDTVEANDALALNKSGSAIGHYRLFRITKANLRAVAKQALCLTATASTPANATWLITNPSFETGNETGWTLIGKDPAGNDEFKARDYGMTDKDGLYLMNAWQWWASSLSVSQTVTDIPSGQYELSGVVATWAERNVTFTGNGTTTTTSGQGDGTGIPVSVNLSIGNDQTLTITVGSTTDWWNNEGGNWPQCFFKLDKVQLTCKGVYLNGFAQPLPNNNTTVLEANQWYYYDVDYSMEYRLIGNITNMVYSTDGDKLLANISTAAAARMLTLPKGRVYFKTTRSDATLSISPARNVQELGEFTAVALNVDGLPNKILTYTLNEDGPGEDGTKKISQYLASKGYDFIGCSEDFNYNGALMESLSSNYSCGTIRKTLSVSGVFGGFPFDTDGLNLIWKNSACSASNESWTRWNDTESTDGNQYVKKGYRHYDMTIGGQTFDVFILHMDAGDTNATWSRHSQWQQLAGAINNADASRPKLIIGDTNSRWTREDIKANFMDLLNSNLVMSDVWVEFARNGIYPTTDMNDLTDGSDPTNYTNYEIVDKIIYINPTGANTAQLIPQSFRIEQDYTYDYVDHDGNTNPLGDHKPVVVTFKYVKSGDEIPFISLKNAESNDDVLTSNNGVTGFVTLEGRTLYKDGLWNTLCLPFDVTVADSQLAGADVRTLSSSSYNEGTLTLNFTDEGAVTEIKAGKPYIVKWASGSNIEDPIFTNVTVESGTTATTTDYVSFVGTYSPAGIYSAEKTNLYMGSNNKLLYPSTDGYTVKSCRAYFQLLNGLTVGDGPFSVRAFNLNFGDENETSIVSIGQLDNLQSDNWYDLSGRRIVKAAKHGIYIVGGKKVVR